MVVHSNNQTNLAMGWTTGHSDISISGRLYSNGRLQGPGTAANDRPAADATITGMADQYQENPNSALLKLWITSRFDYQDAKSET
jgi:hypothetical protein